MFFLWSTLLRSGALGAPGDELSGGGSAIGFLLLASSAGVLGLAGLLFVLEQARRDHAEITPR